MLEFSCYNLHNVKMFKMLMLKCFKCYNLHKISTELYK